MQNAARIQAAIELLDELIASAQPADRIMSQYFRQRRYIGSKDKRAIAEHFYSVMRQRAALDWLLKEHGLQIAGTNLMASYLQLAGEFDCADFSGQRHHPQRLPETDLSALQRIQPAMLDAAPLHVRCNVPEWLLPLLEPVLGHDFEIEMQAMNQRATTDVRVNSLKSDAQTVLAALAAQGIAAQAGQLAPHAVVLKQRAALSNLAAFKQGLFEIQDQGSQLLALATGVQPGDRVVDFCAGAGGKTLALAAMMENRGSITACDVHSKRLQELAKRAKRAGAHNIRVHHLSSERDKWVKQHADKADVVLIDAPCSGTGTWRRNPDSRWHIDQHSLNRLIDLQKSILLSAARLVKPGGRLVYATCSLLAEENEQQVATFLQQFSQFSRSPMGNSDWFGDLGDQLQIREHAVRTFPGRSGCDGFYVAALARGDLA
ncbi:MAG: RsmB/NOP family class I SAM-dependent RNA methyltransferase [Gammaproteobacteria bacterium]|nr:RsmB/NOP family class I SAM-dependent RNA methyltransferase [Gammaproteobacteria bacterium]